MYSRLLMKPIISLLLSCILAAIPAVAQVSSDSVKVYFRLGERRYDPAFRDNSARMDQFVSDIIRYNAASQLQRLSVRASASPDGSYSANERLSRLRCKTITDYLVSQTGIDRSLVTTQSDGVAWEELERMVCADTRVPYRDEVLEVLRTVPVWVSDSQNRIVGSRKKSLMDLHQGIPYRWLLKNIFPELRNSVSITLSVDVEETHSAIADTVAAVAEPAPVETVVLSPASGDVADTVVTVAPDNTPLAETAHTPRHRLAIKTNLLYDAILMPSLEVEYRFSDKWTANAEGDVAWWHNDPKHKYYQVMILSGEGRYWFKHYNDNPWHGFYVGAFGGGGKYDLENGRRGYKGIGYFGGVSAGFMFPVSRNISFETSLGIGYLTTKYEEYLPFEGHYVYQQTSRTGYFGPLKLKFAFVWRLWDINRKKKGGAGL